MKFLKFQFFTFLALLFVQSLFGQTNTSTPFCGDLDLRSCLKEKINSSIIVFEGTIKHSEKYKDKSGNNRIRIDYEVEKVFKGNLKIKEVFLDYDCKDFLKKIHGESIDLTKASMVPPKKGTVGVLLVESTTKVEGRTKISINKVSIPYSTESNFYYPNDKKDFISYQRIGNQEVYFKTTDEVYEFILAQPNTKYEDITYRAFHALPTNEQTKLGYKIIKELSKNGKTSIDSIEYLTSLYITDKNNEGLNEFYDQLFQLPSEELDMIFREELLEYSLKLLNYLDEKNRKNLDQLFFHSRKSLLDHLYAHQKNTLSMAKYYLLLGAKDHAISNFSNVLKINKANLGIHQATVFSETDFYSPDFLSLEHEAFISLLRIYSVDDFRFKMLAKKNLYIRYRNHMNFYAYNIINDKLNKAGYKEITMDEITGKVLTTPAAKAKRKKEDEDLSRKYEWKKE